MVLKDLCELNGVSGNENSVRQYIMKKLQAITDSYQTDKIGNLLVYKRGKFTELSENSSKEVLSKELPKVLLCAHMDEIGLFITEITADGYLKFQPVGGIDPRILVSKKVICGKNTIPGIIGSKAIHLLKAEERKKPLSMEELYIDIGAASKEDAEKVVKIGEYAAFSSEFEYLGPEMIKSKALDDRVGCAVILEILEGSYGCDLIAAFTVQEELGLRGSKVISNYVEADLAIVVEATQAADLKEDDQEEWIVELGRGPACSLMDGATIYQAELIQKVSATARKYDIAMQYRQGTTAANDAGNIHQAGKGIPTITLSIPCRNIHSMSSLISRRDYRNCLALVRAILSDIQDYW